MATVELKDGDTETRLKVNSDGSINAVTGASASYITLVDNASSTVSYIGKANPGSATSSNVWQIQKIHPRVSS